jgi:hypothetical protein
VTVAKEVKLPWQGKHSGKKVLNTKSCVPFCFGVFAQFGEGETSGRFLCVIVDEGLSTYCKNAINLVFGDEVRFVS